jgi:succinoglycan biosynthesis protein ExoM
MKDPLISVVVPTYNRPETLRNALRSLTLQETGDRFSFEIVVVDNASTEPTRAVVAEMAASSAVPVNYVREEVEGYAQALNRGVKEGRGTWLAFFDDDELAEPNWLKELLSAATLTKAQLVGGNIRLQLPHEAAQSLGRVCRSLLGEHAHDGGARACRGRTIPSGGNLLIAREVFNSVGLFDSAMAVGGCDADLVRRARASGATISIAPSAFVRHVIPPYRLTARYLRWTSTRWGCLSAYLDRKESGRAKMFCRFVARAGQAILVNLPLLIFSVLTRNTAELMDRKCLLWRAMGYVRGTVALAVPRFSHHVRSLSGLEFRKERTTFS